MGFLCHTFSTSRSLYIPLAGRKFAFLACTLYLTLQLSLRSSPFQHSSSITFPSTGFGTSPLQMFSPHTSPIQLVVSPGKLYTSYCCFIIFLSLTTRGSLPSDPALTDPSRENSSTIHMFCWMSLLVCITYV